MPGLVKRHASKTACHFKPDDSCVRTSSSLAQLPEAVTPDKGIQHYQGNASIKGELDVNCDGRESNAPKQRYFEQC